MEGIFLPQVQENKMGVMPVKKLIISMSLPMMVSMLVQALYNIVDSIFVSQINEQALTAVSLAFPLQSMKAEAPSATRTEKQKQRKAVLFLHSYFLSFLPAA